MKNHLIVILVSLLTCSSINSQTPQITGKPIAEIFIDFHYTPGDTCKYTGFGINRAHLGYNYTPGGNFSSTLIVNIGSPEDLAAGSLPRRYAFFREASVTYSIDKLTLSFGMVNTRIFNCQQGFWGKRYLGPEYQALYGYGSVADLGAVVDYKLNDILKFDFSLLNGKGYTNVQFDNSLKTAVGLTITASDKAVFRLYGDIMRPGGIWQSTMIAFAGFKNDLLSFGAEASYKTHLDQTYGHDVWGLSATGSVFINEKSEIFGRYDYAASILDDGENLQWDFEKDATCFIGGLEHILSSNLKAAINYRRNNPYEPGKKSLNAIYVNARFRF